MCYYCRHTCAAQYNEESSSKQLTGNGLFPPTRWGQRWFFFANMKLNWFFLIYSNERKSIWEIRLLLLLPTTGPYWNIINIWNLYENWEALFWLLTSLELVYYISKEQYKLNICHLSAGWWLGWYFIVIIDIYTCRVQHWCQQAIVGTKGKRFNW